MRRALPYPLMRQVAARSTAFPPRLPFPFPAAAAAALPSSALSPRSFHSSSPRRQDRPKSPFATFVEVLRDELRKNNELQDNVKQLQGEAEKFQDSAAMQRAREAYERARISNLMKNNPRLREAAEALKASGGKVSEGVAVALQGIENSEVFRALLRATNATADALSTATQPIRDTEAYKAFAETISDALDDTSRGGYEERQKRRERRLRRLAKAGRDGMAHKRVKVNEEAGQALVLHAEASAKQSRWQDYKDNSPFFQRLADLKERYHESESPTVLAMRTITDKVGSWFDENETAQVTRRFKALDPSFTQDSFGVELREYIIPEVVDAYLSADRESLKKWCSEATYNVLWASMDVYLSKGLISDSKVLDIRNVDLSSGKLLDNEVPVFVVTFNTQEILLFRDAKTGAPVIGREDGVEQCTYAAVVTRVEDELDDELTGGWKVIEMARRSSRAFL